MCDSTGELTPDRAECRGVWRGQQVQSGVNFLGKTDGLGQLLHFSGTIPAIQYSGLHLSISAYLLHIDGRFALLVDGCSNGNGETDEAEGNRRYTVSCP